MDEEYDYYEDDFQDEERDELEDILNDEFDMEMELPIPDEPDFEKEVEEYLDKGVGKKKIKWKVETEYTTKERQKDGKWKEVLTGLKPVYTTKRTPRRDDYIKLDIEELKALVEEQGLDPTMGVDMKKIKGKLKKSHYINALLFPQYHNPEQVLFQEDTGDDANGTKLPKMEDYDKDFIFVRKVSPFADLIKEMFYKKLSKRDFEYYALEPQFYPKGRDEKESTYKDYMKVLVGPYNYTARLVDPDRKIKLTGDIQPYIKRYSTIRPLPVRTPPSGYNGPLVGERVSFNKMISYQGFLTSYIDENSFTISGVNEPFNYKDLKDNKPYIISSPSNTLMLSVNDEYFLPYIKNTLSLIDSSSLEFFLENNSQSHISTPYKKIIGLIRDERNVHHWIYYFELGNPVKGSNIPYINVDKSKSLFDPNLVSQYVILFTQREVKGTVIDYAKKDKIKVVLDEGRVIDISISEPSLKVIQESRQISDKNLPVNSNIINENVTPSIRSSVVELLFEYFSSIIPGLVDEHVNFNTKASPLLISSFKSWNEYRSEQFFQWLRAKYEPEIINNLDYEGIAKHAHYIFTKGQPVENIEAIHDIWGLELINELEQRWKVRLLNFGVRESMIQSLFKLKYNQMLDYFKDSKDKTILEIEIEKALINFTPFSPPKEMTRFKIRGGKYNEEGNNLQWGEGNIGTEGQSTLYRPYSEEEVDNINKKRLADLLTRVIRKYMFDYPLNYDEIYKNIVNREIYIRFSRKVPMSDEEMARIPEEERIEIQKRITEDNNIFDAEFSEKLLESYKVYEASWGVKLSDNKEEGLDEVKKKRIENIIKNQNVEFDYQKRLKELRNEELMIKNDSNNPGKFKPLSQLTNEELKELNRISGDMVLVKNNISKLHKQIEIYNANNNSKIKGYMTEKGRKIMNDIELFEKDCMTLTNNGESLNDYLRHVLYPTVFISDLYVGNYSKIFKAKIANGDFRISNLISANLAYYFPEFIMKSTSEENYLKAKAVLESYLQDQVIKFVRVYAGKSYTKPGKSVIIEPFGFSWKNMTTSPQSVCDKDTNSGKTFARDDNGNIVTKVSTHTMNFPVPDKDWLEERVISTISEPVYETIKNENLIICYSPESKKFTCHSKQDIFHEIKKSNGKEVINPYTGMLYPPEFIDKMKERYSEEIDKFVLVPNEDFELKMISQEKSIVNKIQDNVSEYKSDYDSGSELYSEFDYLFDSSEEEDIVKEDIVKEDIFPEQLTKEIEGLQWDNLNSFKMYARSKSKLLVLFCNDILPVCQAFKEKVWKDLIASHKDVTFAEIDTNDTDFGGNDISQEYKTFEAPNAIIMKTPTVILFKNGTPVSRYTGKDKNEVLKLLQK